MLVIDPTRGDSVRRTALVTGASGIVGSHIAGHLLEAGWDVVGAARGEPRRAAGWRLLRVDLADADAVRRALASEPGITHVFWGARAPHPDPGTEARTNTAMLANVLDALGDSATLEHVCLVHGTKWYGSHLGPFATPALEDDPPHLPPNFYVDQAALVAARAGASRWRWSTLRPGVVCGVSLGHPHNLVAAIAAYAAICRALGLPLRFPGTRACFEAVSQVTDARLLARAAAWAATDPRAADGHFNVTNGDLFRWKRLWPRLARHLGMEAGDVQTVPLARLMADKEPLWRELVRRHGLRELPLSDVADWAYADMTFRQDWDHISSTLKARRHGFDDCVDTESMFVECLDRYRDERIVP